MALQNRQMEQIAHHRHIAAGHRTVDTMVNRGTGIIAKRERIVVPDGNNLVIAERIQVTVVYIKFYEFSDVLQCMFSFIYEWLIIIMYNSQLGYKKEVSLLCICMYMYTVVPCMLH